MQKKELLVVKRSIGRMSLGLMVFVVGCVNYKSDCGSNNALPDASIILKEKPSVAPAVVVGGGIAGLTAANYLLQANIPCLLIEGPKPGGALAQSSSVRNWPGVVDAPGMAITDALKNQVLLNGAKILSASLIDIDEKSYPFVLTIRYDNNATEKLEALTCILAMGTEPNYLGVSGEKTYWGRGVFNCAVCDGGLFKNKIVAVVGGGDVAMQDAAYLASMAKQVYVLVRADTLRAKDQRKVDLVKKMPNVTFLYNTSVVSIEGDATTINQLMLFNTQTQEQKKLSVDGLFLAIGSTPNTSLLKTKIACDTLGFVALTKGQETNVRGIFAAGDICDPFLRQAVTSSGMGCQAALQAKDFLASIAYEPQAQPSFDTTKAVELEEEAEVSLEPHEASGLVQEIGSQDELDRAIKNAEGQLLVIDVYGKFCIPCQKMGPVIEALAAHYQDSVHFAKINVSHKAIKIDAVTDQLKTEHIQSVPTFLVIRDGNVIQRRSGFIEKEAFKAFIDTLK